MSKKMCGNCFHAECGSHLESRIPCHFHGRIVDFNMRCERWTRSVYGSYARSKVENGGDQLHLFYLETDSNRVARYIGEVT